MKPQDIFKKVQQLVNDGHIDKAKAFIEDNKDNLGDYFEKAKALLENNDIVKGTIDTLSNFFNKK